MTEFDKRSNTTVLSAKMERLVEKFQTLPGIGQKNAQRLAFFMLGAPQKAALEFADAIRDACENSRLCRECLNFAETDLCALCASETRDKSTVCVVETALDVLAIENSRSYKGVYHVLHGALSPQNGVGPRELKTDALKARVARAQVKEVIIATGLNMEGEATAAYLNSLLADAGATLTRIARGIPTGSVLEQADVHTISHALTAREPL